MGTKKFGKYHIKALVFLFCLCNSDGIFSQSQITFRQLSVKEGLSQNSAISITQDSTGYLWIATQDGLNKYDGRRFTVFPYAFVDITKPDYSNLGKVYNDRQGRLWIIPSDKIPRKLNPKKEIFEPLTKVDDASVIFQSNDLTMWIGTFSKGLYRLPPNASEPEQVLPPSEIGGTVYNITQNAEGKLLLSIDQKILEYVSEVKKVRHIRPRTGNETLVDANFSDIVFDRSGREWVGTFGDGIYYREKDGDMYYRISQLPFTDPLPLDLNIIDLHIDTKGRLWVASYGRGLYLLDFHRNKIVHFDAEKHNPKALHYNDILCIYEDYSGTLWFGTDGAGISYYDEYLEKFNSLTNYETPENINIDVVRSIAVDKKRTVWIGTSGKGLTQYEPETNSWRTFKAGAADGNTITSDRVMSLLVDDDNDLWIGTQGGGLSIRDVDGNFVHYSPTTENPLSANTVWCIYEDDTDHIWLGSREQGLIEFHKEKGEIQKYIYHPDQENSLPSSNIRVITADEEGNLWIGTEADGIAYFHLGEKTFTTYRHDTDTNSISNDNIKSLHFDSDGILWIGTNGGGLNAFDIKNRKFHTYTVEQGLANNVIYAISPDNQGKLWLSSNKGISSFVPGKTLESVPEIKNYTNYDGLATEFNTGASHNDSEGNLYFGGLDGFYWFKPEEIKENGILPKTTITGFEVFDKVFPLTNGAKLSHDQNTVSFTFSSLQYSLPDKNQYRYQLVNYDEDWVQAGNVNFARYTQLPPGDYQFQVKSSNYDGVWNENPVTYNFSVASPWYLTIFAKVIYALLFLAAVFGVYGYLKWRLRMRLDLRLKDEEAQRLQKLNTLKSKLYTDIAHEFRTPLTLISGPVDAKLGEGKLSDADFTNFSMIKRNTNRLIKLVDQLLHLAQLEKGKLKLNISKGNINLFLGMLASSFEYRATQRNIEYIVQINMPEDTWYDEDALEKIVTNLLSNAFKYGRDGGICRLEALQKDGNLHLSVKNTVKTPSDIDIEKLFTRFYQKDEYAEGAGVGLSLVKELVRLYQGEVTVKMEESDLICFSITLPVHFENLKNVELLEVFPREKQSMTNGISDTVPLSTPRSTENGISKELPILLVVEDHKEVREFLKSAWKNRYRIVEANNGKKGIEKALEVVPDLIITDVRMPACDGISLCNTLKTDVRTSHIPIILLTAGVGEEEELKGLQSGADDFVKKPFKLPVLQIRVENLIETRKRLRNRYSQELVLQAKDIAVTPTDEVFLNRLQKVLDEHLSDSEFNTEAFCREIGMSRMQLHRKLLAFTGLSTTAFIRSQRLKQALHILKTSDASVKEVAYTVGFNTPSYFIKCFKETYNKTPSEFLQTT